MFTLSRGGQKSAGQMAEDEPGVRFLVPVQLMGMGCVSSCCLFPPAVQQVGSLSQPWGLGESSSPASGSVLAPPGHVRAQQMK